MNAGQQHYRKFTDNLNFLHHSALKHSDCSIIMLCYEAIERIFILRGTQNRHSLFFLSQRGSNIKWHLVCFWKYTYLRRYKDTHAACSFVERGWLNAERFELIDVISHYTICLAPPAKSLFRQCRIFISTFLCFWLLSSPSFPVSNI